MLKELMIKSNCYRRGWRKPHRVVVELGPGACVLLGLRMVPPWEGSSDQETNPAGRHRGEVGNISQLFVCVSVVSEEEKTVRDKTYGASGHLG